MNGRPTRRPAAAATRMAGLLIGAALVAGAAACAAEPAGPSASATPTPTYTSRYVAPAPGVIAPLSGELLPAGTALGPALTVKIDNHDDARPPIALAAADIVFEELVEGGITRYAAVFESEVPAEIGPVRSIRPMDPDIAVPFGGMIVYSGGQEQFVSMMMDTPVVNTVFDYDRQGLFYRQDGRPSPHDVIVRAQEALALHPELVAPAQQFAFAASPATSTAGVAGAPIASMQLRFSDARYPSWTWDGGRGQFLRFQEGNADVDSEGGQLGATNVIAMMVGIDWSYGIVPRTVMVGSGEAWVATDGRLVHGTWSKESRDAPIRFVDDAGFPIFLAPGNTWVELVPGGEGAFAAA